MQKEMNNIKIGDHVTWISDYEYVEDNRLRGVVKHIAGDVAIVQSRYRAYKVLLRDLTIDAVISLTRDSYRKKVLSVVDNAGCNEDTEEAFALREIASALFEQLEIELFGECDEQLNSMSE